MTVNDQLIEQDFRNALKDIFKITLDEDVPLSKLSEEFSIYIYLQYLSILDLFALWNRARETFREHRPEEYTNKY